MNKKDYITCSACGKKIKLGESIYLIKGLIYKCCSAECLLYSTTNYISEELTQELVNEED